MANLKEIRSRITSVGSTMQITSAMKMVSAAKLKRAQDAVTQMRPYANKLTELLVNLSSTLDSSEGGIYSENRELKKVLLVTITSNRGLCGGFNANIIKKAKSLIEGDFKSIKTEILSIGKKSSEHFKKNSFPASKSPMTPTRKQPVEASIISFLLSLAWHVLVPYAEGKHR